ncbi:MAG: YHS domain-containing (seleno)protein [Pseudomonadota bacterium]
MSLARRNLILSCIAFPAMVLIGGPAAARSPEIYTENGIAVDGSDVVAYFTDSRPVQGKGSITHDWRGATWRFASARNRAAFIADPEAYAPQFGGYCAWAVSNDYIAPTVPEAWTITDGRLYLNYSKGVQRRWSRDMDARIAAGNRNWPSVLG